MIFTSIGSEQKGGGGAEAEAEDEDVEENGKSKEKRNRSDITMYRSIDRLCHTVAVTVRLRLKSIISDVRLPVNGLSLPVTQP